MHVLLLAPVVTPPTPPTPAALLFVETPADTTPMPEVRVTAIMSLLAESDAVEPQADVSVHCIMRGSLRTVVERPDWFGGENTGAVSGPTSVLRGSVTRSSNG